MGARQSAVLHLSAEEFLAWSETQPSDERHELLDGTAMLMSAERAIHARLKGNIYRQFDRGIAAGLPTCEAFVDGMAVRVDDANVFEPDVLVRCGARLPNDALIVDDPLIVVEVASPSTQRIDALTKFARYFRNPSLMHYLIVVPRDQIVIHHRRVGSRIESASRESGTVLLDPPGLELTLDGLFPSDEV